MIQARRLFAVLLSFMSSAVRRQRAWRERRGFDGGGRNQQTGLRGTEGVQVKEWLGYDIRRQLTRLVYLLQGKPRGVTDVSHLLQSRHLSNLTNLKSPAPRGIFKLNRAVL